MTVAEDTRRDQPAVKKVWHGPDVDNVDQEVRKWPSLGHYLFHKLENEFKETILFTDFESGRTWTGGQLKAKIMNVACALLDKYDFQPGTAVCMSYDNSDHLLILACAVLCLGGIVACCYSRDPYAELLYLARKVEPKFLFCFEKNIGWAKQLQTDLGHEVRGIVMNKPAADQAAGAEYFENLFWHDHGKSKSSRLVPVACKDPKKHVALITMSSGTSGKPKAVAQTHWNALADMMTQQRRTGKGVNFACCASLDYVSGRLIMFGAINSGYHVILLNGFEPRTYLQACERYKVHIIYLGAASFYNLISYQHLEQYDISSVKCVFPMGAKIIYLRELGEFFKRHPHIVQVRQGYGASELSGGAMNSMTPEEFLRDSENCGHLLGGMRAKIIHPETGESLGPNQEGILHIRGATVFPGYYDREQVRQRRLERAAAKALAGQLDKNSNVDEDEDESPFVNHSEIFDQDGFYISGDRAYFNDKEQLYFIGRQKELMSCRGQKKVLPQELEELLDQHPAVEKVCVLGVPNRRELTIHCPRAFVVPKSICYRAAAAAAGSTSGAKLPLSERLPGELNKEALEAMQQEQLKHTGQLEHKLNSLPLASRHAIAEDLMEFVNERVGWEKQLTGGIILLDDIPTSRTGKVDKNFLRALTLDQVEIYGDRSGS